MWKLAEFTITFIILLNLFFKLYSRFRDVWDEVFRLLSHSCCRVESLVVMYWWVSGC